MSALDTEAACLSSASTESLLDALEVGDGDSSPIAADKLYVQHAASLCSFDGRQSYELQRGLNTIGRPARSVLQSWTQQTDANTAPAAHAVPLPKDDSDTAWAVIEIDDGLHVVYAVSGSIRIGHRKRALRTGVAYVVGDGKLLWLNGRAFWYRVHADVGSRSPSPPWRQHDAPVKHISPERPARASRLRREAIAERNLSPPLEESPGMFVGLSPLLTHSPRYMLLDDDRGRDHEPRYASSDEDKDNEPRYPSSEEENRRLLLDDTEPLVDTEPLLSSPQLLMHASPTPSPLPRAFLAANTDLRVSESPEPTQPTSPQQRPPSVSPRRTEHLPRASAFVYAPAHIVIQGQHAARFPYDFDQMGACLPALTQSTPPTQPESDVEAAATAETALSSDFSQTFLSPGSVLEPEPVHSRPAPCRTPLNPPKPRPPTPATIRPLHFRHSTPLTLLPSTRPGSRSSDDARRQRSPMADEFPDDLLATGHRRRRSAHHVSTTPSPSLRRLPASVDRIPLLANANLDTPTRGQPRRGQYPEEEPNSSPVLPQPGLLLQARLSETVNENGKDASPDAYDELFDPSVDPPSSLDSPPTIEPSPDIADLSEPSPVKTRLSEQSSVRTRSSEPSPVKAASADCSSAGWINMDEKPKRTPPVGGSRSKSLRESLRRLPGNRGPARTGLSSRRKLQPRKPVAKSHRNLDLGHSPEVTSAPSPRITRQRSAEMTAVPTPLIRQRSSATTVDMATVSTPLTRQRSSSSSSFINAKENPALVTLSGLPNDEKAEVTRVLAQHALETTENPLAASVCVRHGRLGRTLKVLCALARGVPIVPVAWVHGMAAGRSHDAHAHVLEDRATERDWGMTLAATLRRARAAPLLAAFCVIIADVTRDPVCLGVIVRAAGGHVLNDFGGRQEQLLAGQPGMPSPSPCTPALEPTVAALLGADSQSSTEPDNDSDSDWSLEQTRPRTRRDRRKKRRKTLPRLKPAADECCLASEPSLILAPPTAPHTPSTAALGKKRRRSSALPLLLDPACSPAEMHEMLDARKAELDIHSATKLLVVTDSSGPEWTKHGAQIVTPELVIQSIIHSTLQF